VVLPKVLSHDHNRVPVGDVSSVKDLAVDSCGVVRTSSSQSSFHSHATASEADEDSGVESLDLCVTATPNSDHQEVEVSRRNFAEHGVGVCCRVSAAQLSFRSEAKNEQDTKYESVSQLPVLFQRGISMFDDLFDNDPSLELNVLIDNTANNNTLSQSPNISANNLHKESTCLTPLCTHLEVLQLCERQASDAAIGLYPSISEHTLDSDHTARPGDLVKLDLHRPKNLQTVGLHSECKEKNEQERLVLDMISSCPLHKDHRSHDLQVIRQQLDCDVFEASPTSDKHFASDSQEVDPMNHLPVSHSTEFVISTLSLMKDVVSERRQRHNSGQSQSDGRSTTPTELGLCRCTSVTSNLICRCTLSASSGGAREATLSPDILSSFIELPLKGSEISASTTTITPASTPQISSDYNFGRSLMAGYCDHYLSDFVLHGVRDKSMLTSPYTEIHRDLKASVQNSVLDEPIAEASCIVADVDKWSVQLFSCKYNSPDELKRQQLISSQLVCDIIESVHDMWKLRVSPEFCLIHLEDHLQGIYLKSKILAEYIKVHHRLYSHELASLHGFDMSDMPLLLAVAGTHSPDIILSLMDHMT